MALKVYKTIDHSTHKTRYAFVCASSKQRVAEILNTSPRQLSNYGCTPLESGDPAFLKYKHLTDGEVAYEDANKTRSRQGMSTRDLHQIAALGYIDAAQHALDQCDLPDREMTNRLRVLRGQLKDLKYDAKEVLEQKYSGR